LVGVFTAEGQVAFASLIAVITMTFGHLAAFRQTDIRRLLAYSTISQTGYLLLGVVALHRSSMALPGLLYYFAAYVAANIGAFAVVAATRRFEIADNRALVRTQPLLALSMVVALLAHRHPAACRLRRQVHPVRRGHERRLRLAHGARPDQFEETLPEQMIHQSAHRPDPNRTHPCDDS
jgi:hypothetical protein